MSDYNYILIYTAGVGQETSGDANDFWTVFKTTFVLGSGCAPTGISIDDPEQRHDWVGALGERGPRGSVSAKDVPTSATILHGLAG